LKAVFVVNPVAGGGRGLRVWRQLERELSRRGLSADCRFTAGRGLATALAVEAKNQGYDTVIGVGGDGTIQEVVNGLVDAQGGCPATLGIIPAGTGNDFSKLLGYPRDPAGALDVILAGRVRRLDIGRANGRYFINIAGVGFDAEVAAFLNQRPKRLPGALMYVFGVLAVLLRYRPTPLTIDLGAEVLRGKCLLVSVANGPSHAGGMKMCPDASPEDGVLDICVVGDVGRLQTLWLLPKVFSGRHTLHPKVRLYRTTKVRIDSSEPLFVQADGEIFGRVPVDVDVLRGVLPVFAAIGHAGRE